MRGSARLASALLLCALLCAGCSSSEPAPDEARKAKREHEGATWVMAWDQVVDRHEAVAPATLQPLRQGKELGLASVRAGVGAPLALPATACALVVVEGSGQATGPLAKEELEPGRIVLFPDGRGVTISSGEVLRAILVTGKTPGPPGAWRVMDVGTIPVADEPPGGQVELARFEGTLSLQALTVFPLGGIHRHMHLIHDTAFIFLSGVGTVGLGSEAPKGAGDDERSYLTTQISGQVLVFLPKESMHSFMAEGSSRVLALQFFGPAFDGRDGHVLPGRAAAPPGK